MTGIGKFSKHTLAFAALASVPGVLLAQDAAAVLKSVSSAMGADGLRSIRYASEGTGATYGQAFSPGMPWPRITVHSQVRTIDYETGSMREEITISRAEPKGGGGYPAVGQQKNDQFISGVFAWNQTAAGAAAGPRFLDDRTHQLWTTPHGVIKAAIRNGATLQLPGQGGMAPTAVSFTEPGRFKATIFINADHLVERVESRFSDPVFGETPAVIHYSEYRDFGGIKFPMKIQQSQAGFPVLDVSVKTVEPNAAADIQVPENVRTFQERVTVDKVAEGVWFLAGGSHNSVAIEMSDHMILVEAPLNDGRTVPVFEQARQLVPGKPIRYLIASHHHFDHSGGVRAAVAEGATIITQTANKPFFKRAFAVQNTIAPDRLAKSGGKAKFKTVKDKRVLHDGMRTVELHRIKDSVHTDTFLMVFLPKEKLLIEADAFTPLPPNTAPPSPPNPNTVNLVENLERLQLTPDRILPLHGRVVPAADLFAAAGR